MNEEWRLVRGTDGMMVSNMGRIKDKRGDVKKLKIEPSEGYPRISLKRFGKSDWYLIHRLVAEAFLDNPQNKPFVNHKNGIKTDNYVGNLEYCTPRENSLLASKNGQLHGGKGRTEVVATDVRTGEKEYFCSQVEAARAIGCDSSQINKCLHGKRKTTHGYKFEYVKQADIDKAWLTSQNNRQLSLFDFVEEGDSS